MKKLAGVLTFFLPALLSAHTNEVPCLDALKRDTGYSSEKITLLIMTCNVKLVEGQAYLMNDNKFLRMKRYPGNSDMTEVEKGNRIMDFTKCQEITNLYQRYLKRCENE